MTDQNDDQIAASQNEVIHSPHASRLTLGLLVSIVQRHQPFWLGVADAARERDVNLICFVGSELPTSEQVNVPYAYTFDFQGSLLYDLAGADNLDGLITWAGSGVGLGVRLNETEMNQFIAPYRALPIVSYEGLIPGIPSIVTDTYQGMCQLVTHLIEVHGCRRIALIRGPAGHMESEDRHRAYVDTLTGHGLPVDPRLICPPAGWGLEAGKDMAGMLLDQRGLRPGHDFDAVAATEIDYAMGCMRVLQAHGVCVPDQVAIVGFNDRLDVASLDPPITAVRKPFYAAGRKAVETVLDMIAGRSVPDRIPMPCTLIIRRACGCDQDTGANSDQNWIGPYNSPDQILTEADQRIDHYRPLLEISRQMMNTSTISQLTDLLAERLSELGIRTSYVALYENPQPYLYGHPAPEWSRLVLALQEGRCIPLAPEGQRFRTHGLAPDGLLPETRACTLVATPLYFGQRQFGFVLSEVGPRDGLIYQSLTQEISSTLQSISLLGEYQQAERALRESQAHMHTLIEHMPVAVWLKDPGGKYIMQNSVMRQLIGNHVGLTLDDLDINDQLRAKWQAQDQRVLNGETVHTEHTIRRDDGRRIFEQIIAPVRVDGQITAIMGIMFDVTAQKQLEASLRDNLDELKHTQARLVQAQKMQAVGRLAGGVAHDFNNHLTAIQGYAEMVLLDLDPQDPHRADIYEIQRAAERSAELTSQLLAFSRKQVIQPKVLNLNSLIETVRNMLGRLIGEDIELHTVLAPMLGQVKADPGQIEQVVMNLGVNARDAINEKAKAQAAPFAARLTIETANVELDETYDQTHVEVAPGPYVMLAVSDNGIGMDKETMSHLFEPFFTTKEQGRGTGLGLATVYGIVKQNDGYVFPYSNPGVGTTFKVYLPRIESEVNEQEPLRATTMVMRGGETILLVEDEKAVRALARRVLEECGYRVLEAASADRALDLCEQHSEPIHLILTDVIVPGLLSSKEMIDRIGVVRPEIKVIYMSGYTANVIAHHGVLDPDLQFVQKPFSPSALALKVRQVLDGYDAGGG